MKTSTECGELGSILIAGLVVFWFVKLNCAQPQSLSLSQLSVTLSRVNTHTYTHKFFVKFAQAPMLTCRFGRRFQYKTY